MAPTPRSPEQQQQHLMSTLRDPSKTAQDVMGVYTEWAHNYNQDYSQLDYKAPALIAEYMASVLPDKTARVLDIGAGTGQLGVQLTKRGFTDIDCVEPNEGMLEVANKDGKVYNRQIIDFVGTNRLDIEDGTYDVITGCGVFLPGHISPDCFPELTRITKTGGQLFLMCSDKYYTESYDRYGKKFDAHINAMVTDGIWGRVDRVVLEGYIGEYNTYITTVKKL